LLPIQGEEIQVLVKKKDVTVLTLIGPKYATTFCKNCPALSSFISPKSPNLIN